MKLRTPFRFALNLEAPQSKNDVGDKGFCLSGEYPIFGIFSIIDVPFRFPRRALVFSLIIPGAIAATLGIVQMVPPMRRRAAEKGMSGSIVVPAIVASFGLVCMIFGLLLH